MRFLSGIASFFKKTIAFLKDSWSELKKVRWPNRKEMVSYTMIVLVTIIFITIYFTLIDFGLSETLQFIFGES